MTRKAFAAIFVTRLFVDRRSTALACALAVVVAFVQPHGIAGITDPLTAGLAVRSVWLAGPMFFCSAIAIALALVQGPGRHPYLDGHRSSAGNSPVRKRSHRQSPRRSPHFVTGSRSF
jgi:hypothetical protein